MLIAISSWVLIIPKDTDSKTHLGLPLFYCLSVYPSGVVSPPMLPPHLVRFSPAATADHCSLCCCCTPPRRAWLHPSKASSWPQQPAPWYALPPSPCSTDQLSHPPPASPSLAPTSLVPLLCLLQFAPICLVQGFPKTKHWRHDAK